MEKPVQIIDDVIPIDFSDYENNKTAAHNIFLQNTTLLSKQIYSVTGFRY